ncbi:MAG: hypothetical protein LBB67_00785 [Oscillospiraceae bacterium]|jgi:hypothetical protein|nr:hypothetical protein [Oscillospiraceae bacterium]
MLYPKNASPELEAEVFQSPTAEYRATPFWCWNGELNQETLNRQIDCMEEMGFGGFHAHVRVGLTTEYLGDAFMAFIRNCVNRAKDKNMLAWLYDEDRWPSGFAGGLVTRDPQHRAKHLLFTSTPYGNGKTENVNDCSIKAWRTQNGTLLASYAIWLGENGMLREYRKLEDGEQAPVDAAVWYAYLESDHPSDWFNRQTYVDTLSPAAIARFIAVTHERYAETVSSEFGKTVPAIFTDEPQFSRKQTLSNPLSDDDVYLPWTSDLCATYRASYGEELLDRLPELFWELPENKVSLTRYRYHDHVAERFAAAFADQLGNWCGAHHLMLTGHMMEEDTLLSQTSALGDCMRSYRSFQLPGIDMLCDCRNLNTAKQAQSAAHQYGRSGVLSELYGVTNWDFPFRKHKLQGDWQAALGVTVRVPHLYWMSMRGEAKRDYPASIGHQSPWFSDYKSVEDHFARLNTVLTRGAPLVKIGVIHPVESYWLHWGPAAQTAHLRDELDSDFKNMTDWLIFDSLDFDFICESTLPAQFDAAADGFAVGAMRYDVIIVPNCETLRKSTLAALKAFHAKGGKIIFAGRLPRLIDAKPCDDAAELIRQSIVIPMKKADLLPLLEENRLLKITKTNGQDAGIHATQWRQDGGDLWLFISHVFDDERYFSTDAKEYHIALTGTFAVALYDTLTGEIRTLPFRHERGKTLLTWLAHAQDSLLFKLTPCEPIAFEAPVIALRANGKSRMEEVDCVRPTLRGSAIAGAFSGQQSAESIWKPIEALPTELPVTLTEPNVFLLDQAAYNLDDAGWELPEEHLRITDICKEKLHLVNHLANGCQPWVLATMPQESTVHTLRLRYEVRSKIALDFVELAVEDLETLQITWNGQAIGISPTGRYVDDSIQTVALGGLSAGTNLLEMTVPFGGITTIENCFILGDFGVEVKGRNAEIIPPVRSLAFGDWTRQGLPFYGGNVVYHAQINGTGETTALEATHYKQPALAVDVDNTRRGLIAFAPHRLVLGNLDGKHQIDITAFGNRMNTFGALHNINYAETWHGPHAWRSSKENWSYEYRLRPSGIIAAPIVLVKV